MISSERVANGTYGQGWTTYGQREKQELKNKNNGDVDSFTDIVNENASSVGSFADPTIGRESGVLSFEVSTFEVVH